MPEPSGKINDWERAICSRVKTVRESIKWAQSPFAERLGITRDQLASIEGCRTPLRYEIAWNLRQAFDISLRWLEEGFGFADNAEQDNLPIPSATGLPRRALLTAVVKKFSHGVEESLLSIGPEDGSRSEQLGLKSPADFANQEELLNAVMKTLEGKEAVTGLVDIPNRALLESQLRMSLSLWISEVPLGHVYEFTEKLNQFARKFIQSFPADDPSVVGERGIKITWERLRNTNAKKILVAAGLSKSSACGKDTLDINLSCGSVGGMSSKVLEVPTWEQLKKAVARLTSERGQKTALANELGVSRQVLGNWLSSNDQGAPNAELTLEVFRWVMKRGGWKPK